jgi:hypothetical protein
MALSASSYRWSCGGAPTPVNPGGKQRFRTCNHAQLARSHGKQALELPKHQRLFWISMCEGNFKQVKVVMALHGHCSRQGPT